MVCGSRPHGCNPCVLEVVEGVLWTTYREESASLTKLRRVYYNHAAPPTRRSSLEWKQPWLIPASTMDFPFICSLPLGRRISSPEESTSTSFGESPSGWRGAGGEFGLQSDWRQALLESDGHGRLSLKGEACLSEERQRDVRVILQRRDQAGRKKVRFVEHRTTVWSSSVTLRDEVRTLHLKWNRRSTQVVQCTVCDSSGRSSPEATSSATSHCSSETTAASLSRYLMVRAWSSVGYLTAFCHRFFQVAACVRTMDFARFLPEWIAFHYVMGIDEFSFYDNDSADNTTAVLQPFVDAGIVKLIPMVFAK